MSRAPIWTRPYRSISGSLYWIVASGQDRKGDRVYVHKHDWPALEWIEDRILFKVERRCVPCLESPPWCLGQHAALVSPLDRVSPGRRSLNGVNRGLLAVSCLGCFAWSLGRSSKCGDDMC